VKECGLDNWQKEWQDLKNKGKHYQRFDCTPKWKTIKEKVLKRVWLSYIQLKIGHCFFKSYLKRLPNYKSAEYFFHHQESGKLPRRVLPRQGALGSAARASLY